MTEWRRPTPRTFDIVLAGGNVIDGTAEAVPYMADVGIRGDRIAAIGDLGGVAVPGVDGGEGRPESGRPAAPTAWDSSFAPGSSIRTPMSRSP